MKIMNRSEPKALIGIETCYALRPDHDTDHRSEPKALIGIETMFEALGLAMLWPIAANPKPS